jgi:DNA-binding transcriptional regulator LsrR (DeoR family)
MKPILIIRVPKDAVEHIPLLKQKLARNFKLYKVTVVHDDENQKGLKLSVINNSLKSDEILEKEVLKLTPSLGLIWGLIINRIKRFFYFGY